MSMDIISSLKYNKAIRKFNPRRTIVWYYYVLDEGRG